MCMYVCMYSPAERQQLITLTNPIMRMQTCDKQELFLQLL